MPDRSETTIPTTAHAGRMLAAPVFAARRRMAPMLALALLAATPLPAAAEADRTRPLFTVPSDAERLALPFRCSRSGDRVTVTPAATQELPIVGARATTTVSPCASVRGRQRGISCQPIEVHRFDVACGDARVAWSTLAAAIAQTATVAVRLPSGTIDVDGKPRPLMNCTIRPVAAAGARSGSGATAGGALALECKALTAEGATVQVVLPSGYAPLGEIGPATLKTARPQVQDGPGRAGSGDAAAAAESSTRGIETGSVPRSAVIPPSPAAAVQPATVPAAVPELGAGAPTARVMVPDLRARAPVWIDTSALDSSATETSTTGSGASRLAGSRLAADGGQPRSASGSAEAAPVPSSGLPTAGGLAIARGAVDRGAGDDVVVADPTQATAGLLTAPLPPTDVVFTVAAVLLISATFAILAMRMLRTTPSRAPHPGVSPVAGRPAAPRSVPVSRRSRQLSDGAEHGNAAAVVDAMLRDTRTRLSALHGPLTDVLGAEIAALTARLVALSGVSAEAGADPERIAAGFRSLVREVERVQRIIDSAALSMGRMPETTRLPATRSEAYALLGVNPGVAEANLKKLADALRMSWHPDLARDDDDRQQREARIRAINAALDLIHGRRAA